MRQFLTLGWAGVPDSDEAVPDFWSSLVPDFSFRKVPDSDARHGQPIQKLPSQFPTQIKHLSPHWASPVAVLSVVLGSMEVGVW